MKHPFTSFLALLLAACSTSGTSPPQAAGESATDPPGKSKEAQLTDIATTPLSDLNLVRAKIPPVLLAAQKKPYAAPETAGCAALATDIQALDAVLGADLDVPPNPEDPGLVQRGGAFLGDAAVGVARGAAEGVVPFRSWVRKLTGAEKHAREVAAAISAGIVRRAYLKGLGMATGCPPPAAPRPPPSGRTQEGDSSRTPAP